MKQFEDKFSRVDIDEFKKLEARRVRAEKTLEHDLQQIPLLHREHARHVAKSLKKEDVDAFASFFQRSLTEEEKKDLDLKYICFYQILDNSHPRTPEGLAFFQGSVCLPLPLSFSRLSAHP